MPDEPPKPIPRRKRISDERILDAACLEFARAGYEAARMEAVAEAARSTKATLYARFCSKAELFEATLVRESTLLRESLFRAYSLDSGVELAERIGAYVDAYFTFGHQRPAGFRLLFLDDGGRASAVESSMQEEVTARIAQLIVDERGGRRITSADRLLAAMIVGATHYGAGAAAANGISLGEATRATKRFLLAALTD